MSDIQNFPPIKQLLEELKTIQIQRLLSNMMVEYSSIHQSDSRNLSLFPHYFSYTYTQKTECFYIVSISFMRISIIGYGAFGKLWADILAPDFEVVVTGGSTYEERAKMYGHTSVTREEALLSDIIFYSVPISLFEKVIEEDIRFIETSGHHPLMIDLLSVKVHPEEVFKKYLPKNIQTLLMHPMFGPESVGKNGGLHGLNLVLCGGTATSEVYNFWK